MESKKTNTRAGFQEAWAQLREKRAEEFARRKAFFESDIWKEFAERVTMYRDRSRADLERQTEMNQVYRSQGALQALNAILDMPAGLLKETDPNI